MNIMLDGGGILTAVHDDPETYEEVWWGKKLSAVRVKLPLVESQPLAELLTEAWELRAPRRLL